MCDDEVEVAILPGIGAAAVGTEVGGIDRYFQPVAGGEGFKVCDGFSRVRPKFDEVWNVGLIAEAVAFGLRGTVAGCAFSGMPSFSAAIRAKKCGGFHIFRFGYLVAHGKADVLRRRRFFPGEVVEAVLKGVGRDGVRERASRGE